MTKIEKIIQAGILEADFGSSKKFISNVFESVGHMCGYSTLNEMKADLVSLHRAGRVKLSRADLVTGMDLDTVLESETHDNMSQYHFVVVR